MKYKYLYRLIAIIILALMIPIILFLKFFWQRSLEELEEANEVYYESKLDGYKSLYDAKIRELDIFVGSISAESKVSTGLLYDGIDEVYNNEYQLYMLIKELKKNYSRYDFHNWGIYFYEIDKIVRPWTETAVDYKYYVHNYLDENNKNEQLDDFFSAENYAPSKIMFSTTSTSDNYDGKMLVGFCTKIGRHNDKALIFFEMESEELRTSLAIISEPGIACYFLDNNEKRILCSWGDTAEANAAKVIASETAEEVNRLGQKVLYQKDSSYPSLSFAIYITEDSLHSNIVSYANNMQMLQIIMATILCIICVGVVYVSYKPVYELVQELGYSGGSEFDMIRRILDKKSSKITEQEMLIMDLLMKHLINGVHVSEKKMKNLGIDASFHYFCVFLLDGYVLLSNEVELLANTMKEKFSARLFVTDWQEKNSIFILFLKKDNSKGVQEVLKTWMEECFIEEYPLYAGKTVDKLDDIQLSFRSCCKLLKKKETDEIAQNRLKEDIMAYMDQNYLDVNLSQMQVADLFGISHYTLSRLFKNQIGVGFAEYLVSKRIEYAKELLLTTSYSISEVAAMSGFSGIKYFSSAFKLYVGVSPSVFRKRD